MQAFLIPYLLSVLTVAAVDFLWLGVVMKDFYRSQIGHLLSGGVGWAAAIVFYFIFTAGVFYFAVAPAAQKGSIVAALVGGALFGLFAYATYDLSNMATLKNWPLSITVIDILWGTVLSGALGMWGYFLFTLFNK